MTWHDSGIAHQVSNFEVSSRTASLAVHVAAGAWLVIIIITGCSMGATWKYSPHECHESMFISQSKIHWGYLGTIPSITDQYAYSLYSSWGDPPKYSPTSDPRPSLGPFLPASVRRHRFEAAARSARAAECGVHTPPRRQSPESIGSNGS